MRYYITAFLLIVAVGFSISIIFSNKSKAEGNYVFAPVQVRSRIYVLGDYIYCLKDAGIIAKYSKTTLSEADILAVNECYSLSYSSYLDKLIAGAFDPVRLVVIDYDNMSVVGEHEFRGTIKDIDCYNDKIYVVCDDSGYGDGDMVDPLNPPVDTGKLTEVNATNFNINWEIATGSFPEYVEACEDYVCVYTFEGVQYPNVGDGGNVDGHRVHIANKVDIIDRSNQARTTFYNPGSDCSQVLYNNGYLYIANSSGLPGYEGPQAGLTKINISNGQMEFIVLEADEGDWEWKAEWLEVVDGTMYISYSNSEHDGESTYYGKYNLTTGELEDVMIQGICKSTSLFALDGDDIYFTTFDYATSESGILKYTET